jgi:hypothetical protein
MNGVKLFPLFKQLMYFNKNEKGIPAISRPTQYNLSQNFTHAGFLTKLNSASLLSVTKYDLSFTIPYRISTTQKFSHWLEKKCVTDKTKYVEQDKNKNQQ